MNGAERLLQTARAAGIDVCFANPGTTEMPLVVALDSVTGMRPVLGVFEGVCTGAADGFGRMAGRPALTLLHLGPGLANGAANLHNARRAHTPVVNLIGDHTTRHLTVDSALKSDIAGLAAPVSDWVRTCRSADSLGSDFTAAVRAATTPPGRVATLIVPADLQSTPAAGPAPVGAVALSAPPAPPVPEASRVAAAAAALRRGASTALLLGGAACRRPALDIVARIAAASGCRLIVETFPARMECGAGTPRIERFPYFPEQVAGVLGGIEHVVLAGTPDPVALFGWPGAPSRMLPEHVSVVSLAQPGEDIEAALAAVAEGLRAPASCDAVAALDPAARPSGPLDVGTLAAAVAATLPEGAVVVDEGATSSVLLYPALASAPPHTWLTLTGGAIGQGLPCATGAAIACPDRKVVAFQADGSGLYTLQALWTQARESLDVTTIICANRTYRILQIELMRSGIAEPGHAARRLTDLSEPALDWVRLATGMGVPAARAEDAETLVREIERAFAAPGPHLIEAILG
jgi:acetolactate synthase-1/2/3 large subunit